MKYVKWFKDLTKEDVDIAGGKGANLGEMTRAEIPVPPGFVVLSSAYFSFLEYNKLRPHIHQVLSTCDISDPAQLNEASKKIQKLLHEAEIPAEISREIFTSYHELNQKYAHLGGNVAVAVRSSATAEDLPEASFAGQQESYLNISGDANVLLKVRECWMSLFGARSIFYREQQKFDHFKVGIAVPIQKMVQSEVSGVMFTVDPISKDKHKLVIEAIYGLGDYIVQGVVTPDHYEIDTQEDKIIINHQSKQEVMEVRDNKGLKELKVPVKLQEKQKLPDEYILKLAKMGKKIHHHYFFPQDIEWAYENKTLYIIQSRPITTLGDEKVVDASTQDAPVSKEPAILKGAPASPGLVSGPVRIVDDISHLDKVKKGDIMVTDMTTPDFVPAMKRAAGIITNRGGLTSHAAIVSRELGVPCVVGTTTATKVLKDGMIVTLNGNAGEIFKGALSRASIHLPAERKPEDIPDYKTATHIFVNLAEPELAEKISKQHVDGVGLLRAEFMIAGIGTHPKKLIEDGKGQEFTNKLAHEIAKFCKAFDPRPVIYRATDFKTNEYRSLKGGDKYEPEESNPMLGFRGAFRYIKNPEVFNLELEAIKKVRNQMGYKNLSLMIPFVSNVQELVEVKKLVAAAGLYRSASFKFYMMCEIPANVILLDDFIDVGIDGVSIGSNDLTMLILGIDRDNSEVATQFSELNPAVLWALERIVKTCAKRGIKCSICGQAPSEYPDLVEKLVAWGVTSISVNPDAIARTREIVYHSEEKLIKHSAYAQTK
jgi:pyruvate, water dikinase